MPYWNCVSRRGRFVIYDHGFDEDGLVERTTVKTMQEIGCSPFRILRVASRGATASAVMVVVVVAMCLQYLGERNVEQLHNR